MPGKGTGPTDNISAAAHAARLRYVEEELKDLRKTLKESAAALKTLESRFARVERGGSDALEARVTLLGQEVDELSEDFDTAGATLQTLQERVETLASASSAGAGDSDGPDEGLLPELRESLATELRASLTDELRESLADELRESLADELRESLAAELRDAVFEEVRDTLEAELRGSLAAERNALRKELDEVRTKPRAATKPKTDGLTSIKGIGPTWAKKLSSAGVTKPSDVASWSDEEITRLHSLLGATEKRLKGWRSAAKQSA
ncbi:MAG: helix-hairpin-helix domain-containing protein [Myxococcota bacterium]